MTNEQILKIALAEKAVVAAAVGWASAPGEDEKFATKTLLVAVGRLLEVKESK